MVDASAEQGVTVLDGQSLQRRGAGAAIILLIAAALVAALIVKGVRLFTNQERAHAWETHIWRVISVSKDLMNSLERGDSAERGFLLSGGNEASNRFQNSAADAQAQLSRLEFLTRDNPRQQWRLADLKLRTELHLASLERRMEERPAVQPSASDVDRAQGDRLAVDDLRMRVGAILGEEQRLLTTRAARSAEDSRNARLALYLLSAAGIALLASSVAALVMADRAAARLRVADVERRSADELAKARDFLQAVVDGAMDPIYVKDREGRFLLGNLAVARVYAVQPADMIGKGDAEFTPPATARALAIADQRIMGSGEAEVVEEIIPTAYGERIFLSSKAPWKEDGVVRGLIGVSQDITDRKRAEVALRDLNEQLEERVAERTREIEHAESQIRQMQKMESIGQLTGGIAHDFNNMLAIVIGSLDIAARNLGGDDQKVRRFLANAHEGASRAASLTSRLLAFSRQQPLSPESLDANKLVSGMSEMLERTLGEAVKIETVLAGGLWRTLVDPNELENALLNLCVNARDAMPDGGRLTVETNNAHLDDPYAASHADVEAGQYVLICVSDTGEGIAPDVLERVFDPFYTTKEVGKGTGLGLSQVYGFIKQSGGHVKIYSEVGHGTTVKIYLPRYFGPDVSRPTPEPTTHEPTPRATAGEIVLVVEDEAGVRNLSIDALRELGYTVLHADTPAAALDILIAEPKIDLLFTDIIMPGLNGRQLADRAKALRPQLKVLYTTGYTRNAVVHNGVLDPGVAFLPKPFTVNQLGSKVRSVLDS